MTTATGIPGKGTFSKGVHPPDRKEFAAEQAIEVLPTPSQVVIPVQQHVGAPCENLTKNRQEVACGEIVGKAEAFVSAPIHATVNGKTAMPKAVTLPNGRHMTGIVIKAEGNQLEGDALYQDVFGGEWPTTGLDKYQPDQIVESVKSAGIVGQGGAAFPTFIKLLKNADKPIDTLLLNGCECEPYLTADYRMMVEAPAAIICGSLLAAKACGAKDIIIAVEDNKPKAIEALEAAAKGTNVKVAKLHTKYPQGGEKQTVKASLDRDIPTGGLPLDVGVVVINVGTAAAVARAVTRNKALTHRVITVSGAGINNPKNILAPVGVTYQELIDFAGGLKPEAVRVVAGGPMMGFAFGNLDAPVTKGTSGITVLTEKDIEKANETNCVRCGKCVDVCPMDLVPTRLALASRNKQWDLAKKYYITSCMECGCCAFVCPASIPLVQLIRKGKAKLPRK